VDVEAPRLEGKVDSVVYRNEENGYTVLRLLEEGLDEPATVVGCMPGVSVGETLTVTGLWGHHATYGAQFKAKTVEHSLPQGADAILEYLSSGAVKGIVSQRLVRRGGPPRRPRGGGPGAPVP